MTTEEDKIIEQANEIIHSREKEKRFKEESNIVKTLQGKVGKYFKTYEFNDEKKHFYRVMHDSWRDSQVKVEYWRYSHDGYYGINLETWYNDRSNDGDKEISETEFMEAVTWFMKKLGVYQIITQETNH